MAKTHDRQQPANTQSKTATVLIVDDDVDFAEAQAEFLATNGYRVAVAHDCREALEADRELSPQIALIDLKLGRESGIDVIDFLKAQSPRLDCVVLTGYGGMGSAVDALRRKAADYLTKPVDPTALLLVLDRILEKQGLIAAKEAADEASRALEARVQASSDLLSRASHEFRTPMNAIMGFGQVLQMDADDLPLRHRESIDCIVEASEHLLALIDSMLDLSTAHAGKATLDIRSVPVRKAVLECILLVDGLARDRGVTILDVEGSTASVSADYQRLKQVLLNLLSNAVKFNRERGSVEVTIDDARDGLVRIEIEDTGHGVSQADTQRIFEPFHRLSSSGDPNMGTGLGLTISKMLVEEMGGQIGVESTVGQGSTFWIELPKAEPAETAD